MSAPPRDALSFPTASSTLLVPYLPSPSVPSQAKPHLTLTYATSLDANISLAPATQTALSGPQSKAMTHHLRAHHAAILIGAGTAVADNPSLNCRIEGVGGYGGEALDGQPQPVVLDARGRWDVGEESKVIKLAREGRGRAPWVLIGEGCTVGARRMAMVEAVGGKYIRLATLENGRFDWNAILRVLGQEGIGSVMVEGGGTVINELLSPKYIGLVDTVIVTIAPVWLGKDGVQVCPEDRRGEDGRKMAVGRLGDVRWVPLGEDVVLCGRPKRA